MCRMNVEIKWLLMKRYASYWNMLPEEMQLLIMSYRDGQARVDMRRSVAGKRMCRQIREYGLLRLEWMLGHIECRLRECICHCLHKCKYCHCERMRIFGHYLDLSGVKKSVFLGFNFKEGLDRCERVKLNLGYQTDPLYTLLAVSLR